MHTQSVSNFPNSILLVLDIAGEKLLSNLSRFVVIMWVFVVFVLTSSYKATLSSLLTLQQVKLASKGEYIGYQGGSWSFVQGVIVSNLEFKDPYLRSYFTTEDYADALSRGNNNGGVSAIIDEIPCIEIFLGKYPADHALIASDSTTNGFGFAFQKGSPLVPEISKAILKLREEGKLEMMEKAWASTKSSFVPQSSASNSPTILNVDSFVGLFLISGLSSAMALGICYFYRLREMWNAKVYYLGNLTRGLLLLMMRHRHIRI